MREIGAYDLVEPTGWIIIPLRDPHNPQQPIKTWMLQLAVLANHQNGRDTHIRQIKIHSPIETTSVLLQPKFTAVEIAEWSTIRWKVEIQIEREIWFNYWLLKIIESIYGHALFIVDSLSFFLILIVIINVYYYYYY